MGLGAANLTPAGGGLDSARKFADALFGVTNLANSGSIQAALTTN
jgi:hypothetical protein